MRSERGHTILLATILGIVAFSAWALAFLTTRDLVRTEKIVRVRGERDQSVTRALGRGIYLLRTGFPPVEPYECIVTVAGSERTYDCTVRFEQEPGSETWTVTALRSTDEDLGMLPPAPARFRPRGDDEDDEDDDDDDDEDKDKDKDDDEDKEEAARAAQIRALQAEIAALDAALKAKPKPSKTEKKRLKAQKKAAEKLLDALLDD